MGVIHKKKAAHEQTIGFISANLKRDFPHISWHGVVVLPQFD
jgi:hypothetical protein